MKSARYASTSSIWVATIIALTCVACIFSKQTGSASLQANFAIPSNALLVLSQVPDGSGADGVMAGSGDLVRSSLGVELLKRGFQVHNSDASQLQQLLGEAKSKGVPLVLLARITIWEDNATAWSGKRDHAGISLQLFDTETGALKGSSERTANGVRQPSDCAPWLAQTAVAAMLGDKVDEDAGPPC